MIYRHVGHWKTFCFIISDVKAIGTIQKEKSDNQNYVLRASPLLLFGDQSIVKRQE